MTDLAPTAAVPAPVTPATDRLICDSTSANTRRAYAGALDRLDASLDGRPTDDAGIAEYLGTLDAAGKSPATASMVIAAVRFRAKLAGQPDPVGPIADRAHKGFRRAGRNERGQAPALDLDAIREIAGQCTPLDRAIVLTMFQACLHRSEAAALEWRDIEPAATPGALRITVRASKTNQEGAPDVRLVKNGAAKALLAIRPDDIDPAGRREAGRIPGHRPQRPRHLRQRIDPARHVHDRSHAGRCMEDRPHGRPLQRRSRRRRQRHREVPLTQLPPARSTRPVAVVIRDRYVAFHQFNTQRNTVFAKALPCPSIGGTASRCLQIFKKCTVACPDEVSRGEHVTPGHQVDNPSGVFQRREPLFRGVGHLVLLAAVL